MGFQNFKDFCRATIQYGGRRLWDGDFQRGYKYGKWEIKEKIKPVLRGSHRPSYEQAKIRSFVLFDDKAPVLEFYPGPDMVILHSGDNERTRDACNRFLAVLGVKDAAIIKWHGALAIAKGIEVFEQGEGIFVKRGTPRLDVGMARAKCPVCQGSYPTDLFEECPKCKSCYCLGCAQTMMSTNSCARCGGEKDGD